MELTKKMKDLIKEGCLLNDEIKPKEKRIKEIKTMLAKLGVEQSGTYIGSGQRVLVITSRDLYGPPNPKDLYSYMQKKKYGNEFFDCVQVMKEKTVEAIGETEYSKLESFDKTSRSFSFK